MRAHADENKALLVRRGLLPLLVGLLERGGASLKFTVLIVLKNLVLRTRTTARSRMALPGPVGSRGRQARARATFALLGAAENGEALVADARGLAAIAATFEASDHDGTCFEAARIYANLARLQRGNGARLPRSAVRDANLASDVLPARGPEFRDAQTGWPARCCSMLAWR